MDTKERVKNSIYGIIDDINPELPDEMKLDKLPDCIIFGEGGRLDSLGLVNLVVAAEQKLQEYFEIPISISDARAMSQKNSPFRTVESLINYISTLIEESDNGR